MSLCRLVRVFVGLSRTVVTKLCKNIFDFTTAGEWDCVAAVERLSALLYSVDFIFLSFGIMVSLWNF